MKFTFLYKIYKFYTRIKRILEKHILLIKIIRYTYKFIMIVSVIFSSGVLLTLTLSPIDLSIILSCLTNWKDWLVLSLINLLSKLLSEIYHESGNIVEEVITKKVEIRNKQREEVIESLRKTYKFSQPEEELSFLEKYQIYLIVSSLCIVGGLIGWYFWDDILAYFNPDNRPDTGGSDSVSSPDIELNPLDKGKGPSLNITTGNDSPPRLIPKEFRGMTPEEAVKYFKEPSSSTPIKTNNPFTGYDTPRLDSPDATPKARPMDILPSVWDNK